MYHKPLDKETASRVKRIATPHLSFILHHMNDALPMFEGFEIRKQYDEKTETWYFSVVDIVRVLTQQADFQAARKYWNKLKERLNREGSESVTKCHQLKLTASDGKGYLSDAADTETIGVANWLQIVTV